MTKKTINQQSFLYITVLGALVASNTLFTSYKIDAPKQNQDQTNQSQSYKINTSAGTQPESYKLNPVPQGGDQGGEGFFTKFNKIPVIGGMFYTDRAKTITSVKIENSTDHELIIIKADTPLSPQTLLSSAGPSEPVIVPAQTKSFTFDQEIKDENRPDVREYIVFFLINDEPIEVCRFLYGIACNQQLMNIEIPQNYQNPKTESARYYQEHFDKIPTTAMSGSQVTDRDKLKEEKTIKTMFPRLMHKELFTSWGAYHKNFTNISLKTGPHSTITLETIGAFLMSDQNRIEFYFRSPKTNNEK